MEVEASIELVEAFAVVVEASMEVVEASVNVIGSFHLLPCKKPKIHQTLLLCKHGENTVR